MFYMEQNFTTNCAVKKKVENKLGVVYNFLNVGRNNHTGEIKLQSSRKLMMLIFLEI